MTWYWPIAHPPLTLAVVGDKLLFLLIQSVELSWVPSEPPGKQDMTGPQLENWTLTPSPAPHQGGNCEIAGKSDADDFRRLLAAMEVLGFTSEDQDSIFRILASILHLGNVYFEKHEVRGAQPARPHPGLRASSLATHGFSCLGIFFSCDM